MLIEPTVANNIDNKTTGELCAYCFCL